MQLRLQLFPCRSLLGQRQAGRWHPSVGVWINIRHGEKLVGSDHRGVGLGVVVVWESGPLRQCSVCANIPWKDIGRRRTDEAEIERRSSAKKVRRAAQSDGTGIEQDGSA